MKWKCIALAALIASPAAAEPIYDMCIRPGSQGPEQCDCIVSGLGSVFAQADHILYTAIAERYLQRLDEGMGQADAWDAAIQSEAMARNVGYPGLKAEVDALAARYKQTSDRCRGG